MSSNAVEPGTRLVDRYRLEKHLGEAEGASYWRAVDELLDRPVGVTLLAASHAHAEQVLRAARRAAAVTDARFLRVLDASEVDGVVYVVNEWVRATNLVDLLADGPLPAAEARDLGIDVAQAMVAAHTQGLAHLCLRPEHVLRTSHGQVKIVGLAVEAAAQGVAVPDPEAAAARDTRGVAEIVYAMLTARWPGETGLPGGLPAAPHDGAALCSPRQVRAGVPHDLDSAVSRALGIPGNHGSHGSHSNHGNHPAALRSLPALADALGDAHLTTRIPVVRQHERGAAGSPYPPAAISPYDDQGPRQAGRTTLLAWGVVVLVLVVGLGLAGGQLVVGALGRSDKGSGGDPTPRESTSTTPPATGARLDVASVTTFDPEGDGEENQAQAGQVVDGKASTVWISNYYKDPFGPTGLKDGVGLVLDLGASRQIGAVRVRTVGGGTDFEVRTSDRPGSALDDFDPMGKPAQDVDGPATVRPEKPVRARYVLVWLTRLPVDGSVYRGRIAEISVYG